MKRHCVLEHRDPWEKQRLIPMGNSRTTPDEFPKSRRWKSLTCVAMSVRRAISRAGFARNVVILSSGAGIGQVLGLIAMPVVARLYRPDQFGVLGMYGSVLAIVSVVAMLRYESAIPISKTDSEAVNATALSCGIAVVTSLLCALLALFFAGPVATLLRVPNLASVAWLIPVGILAVSAYRAFSLWAVRAQDYSTLAKTKVTQGLGLILTQVGLGLLRVGSAGLIIGQIVGQSAGTAALVRRVYEQDRNWSRGISRAGMIQVARRYSRFPKFSSGAALLDSLNGNLPLLFLGTVLGTTIAGWYTFLQQTLLYPVNLMTFNVAQVYYGEIVQLRRTNPEVMLGVFVTRITKLATVGLAMVVAVNLIAPWFVPLVFGKQWNGAVTCLQILSPMVLIGFIASPTGSTPEALQRQDLHLVREVFRVTTTILALSIAYFLKTDWVLSLGLISAAGVINYSFYLLVSWYAIRSYVRNVNLAGLPTLSGNSEGPADEHRAHHDG
jgi:O-antigen/teichoic acid export membrane protein